MDPHGQDNVQSFEFHFLFEVYPCLLIFQAPQSMYRSNSKLSISSYNSRHDTGLTSRQDSGYSSVQEPSHHHQYSVQNSRDEIINNNQTYFDDSRSSVSGYTPFPGHSTANVISQFRSPGHRVYRPGPDLGRLGPPRGRSRVSAAIQPWDHYFSKYM